MSGPAIFQAAARKVADSSRYSLLRIYTPTFIQVSTKDVFVDGLRWDPLLLGSTVQNPGAFLTNDTAFSTMSATLSTGPLSAFSGQGIAEVMASTALEGCAVELFYMEDSITTGLADGYRAFFGVIEDWELGIGSITIKAIQRTDFNGSITPKYVNRRDYPQSPDDAVDAAIPVLFGDFRAQPLRPPFASPYPVTQRVGELLWGGGAVAKGILVDTGRGGGGSNPKAKAVVASHAMAQLGIADPNAGPFGTSFFLENPDGGLDAMDPGTSNTVNTSTESGLTIPDGAAVAYRGVVPSDVRLVSNYAEEPRAILDPRETRWAIMDYDGLKRYLLGTCPSLTPPGTMTHVWAYLRYFTGPFYANGRFNVQRGATSTAVVIPASTTPTFISMSLGTAWASGSLPNAPWNFSESELQIDFNGPDPVTPVGQIYPIDMGFVVEYIPNQDLLETEKMWAEGERRPGFKTGDAPDAIDAPGPHTVRAEAPAVTELRGKFFVNGMGWKDSVDTGQAAGTFTGSANARIERPCDLAAMILCKYGGEAPSSIEYGSSVDGSFTDARALLQCWDGSDMRLAFGIADSQDVATTLAKIGEACASWVFLDESTDTWRFIPWRDGMPSRYSRRLLVDDLLGEDAISVSALPKSRLLTGLTIPYLWNEASGGFLSQVSASMGNADSRSCGGYLYSNIRDQDLEIRSEINDRFQVMSNGSFFTQQFAPGSGRDWMLGRIVALNTGLGVGFGSSWWSGAFGGYVPAGCKCLAYNPSNVLTLVTFTPGSYSMGQWALQAQSDLRLQTGDSSYTVTWDSSTGKYTIGRGGSFLLQFIGNSTNGYLTNNAAALFGFRCNNFSINSTRTSDVAVAKDCFTVTGFQAFNILWRSGSFGLLGANGLKNVADLWGFEGHYDSSDGGNGTTIYGWTGVCPKGGREQTLEAAAARYSLKRDTTVEGRYIRDTKTALELRNRLIDLLTSQRLVVKFTTGSVVDVGRGEVLECSGEWDAVLDCPGEGRTSWDGFRMVVVETQKRAGDAGWIADIVGVQV